MSLRVVVVEDETLTRIDLIEILNKKETGLDFNYINLDIIKQSIDKLDD